MIGSIQPLDRVFLEIGPLTIYWYGLLIGSGVLLGLWVATREADRLGLEKDVFIDVVLYAIPMAIVCARLYYVIFEWSYFSQNPGDIIKVWEGGLAIHGGLIGAFLTTYFFAKIKKISFWKLVDIAVPSILIGQIIGRWGNFMNQEAFGRAVSREFLEGLHLPTFIINQMYINGQYWHPTFLYESLWNVVGLVILLLFRRINLLRGEMFLSYLIWYSIGRFFIEGLRTDSLMLTDSLRAAQMISIVIFVGALITWIYRRKVLKVQEHYLDR